MRISKVFARQVLDSRGNPTVEAEVWAGSFKARAIAPSGASTGSYEALELRDGGSAFNGKGVSSAVRNVNELIAPKILGMDPSDQAAVDQAIIELDGTPNKSRLGANATVAVSMACARVAALCKGRELFQHLGELYGNRSFKLPTPFMNVINGGLHADNSLDFQEYMISPRAESFSEALRIGVEVYHSLKEELKKLPGFKAGVGDEGGFAPDLSYEEPFKVLSRVVERLGYSKQVKLAMDAAASTLYKDGSYSLQGSSLSVEELSNLYLALAEKYPLSSIEDPFHEEAFNDFSSLKSKLGRKCLIVGDDLLVTNPDRVLRAARAGSCDALLLKVNQVGTVTEAFEAARIAKSHRWKVMVSHRSGETEDSFIADLAVGIGAEFVKAGAPCRGERTAKYNQLLRIEGFLNGY